MPPSSEARRRTSSLKDYTENFSAPLAKQQEVEALLTEIAKYEFRTPIVPLENLREGYIAYHFSLVNEMSLAMRIWETPLSQHKYVNGNMRQMEEVRKRLALKQGTRLPSKRDRNMWNHAQSVFVMAANVEKIDAIFTNAKRGKPVRRPKWFIENDIPHPREDKDIRTDLVIIGSDNRFRMFEHGNSTDKPNRVRNQAGGLHMLYRKTTNDSLPPGRILAYVVQYAVEEETITQDIYPIQDYGVSVPRRERSKEQLVFHAAD